jgi:ketosteroid isomerase-like protein
MATVSWRLSTLGTAMRLLLAVILAALFAAPTRAADADAIRQVVQQFQSAIVAHDGKTLGSLFVQDGGSWLSVLDDTAYADAKGRNPAAKKLVPSTWQKFADFVQHSAKPIEERFYDVRIDTNGTVASVWFNFDFLVDGKVANRGSESWQLVRTDDGWKIQAMLYSVGR